jgi:hypothetical protein
LEDEFKKIKIDGNWYYVILQNPNTETEQFVGFNDSETKEKFLPAFKTKDAAQACFALMPKDLFNGNYDTQAVIGEDLLDVADKNEYKIFLLDEKGTILEHLN